MERLKEFLYYLMRDEVVLGIVEKIMQQVEATGIPHGKDVVYSNKYLEWYAEELAKRLKE